MTTEQQIEALATSRAGSAAFKEAVEQSSAAALRHALVYRRLSRPAQRAILKRLLELKTT